MQRDSMPAKHVFLGWLIDCAIHWTPSASCYTL